MPAAARAAGPSGVAMPSGNLDGWKQIFSDDFDKDAGVGHFPGGAYGGDWDVYSDGTPDTTGKATYMPSKVLSARDGMLDWYLHSEGDRPYTATALPKIAGSNAYKGITYGRFTTRFRVTEAAPRYSQVFLLWPDSERWPADGEFDFPAGDLGGTIGATAIHAQSSYENEQFPSPFGYTGWHTATLEWSPGLARFFVDGQLIGATSQKVAHNPMHYVLQVESTETSASGPSTTISTHLQLDWISVWSYSPGTPASQGNGGGGATAVTARISVKPGRCTRSKARTVNGLIGLRFPARARHRTARIAGRRLANVSSINTKRVANGLHKIAVGYRKPGHRRTHGCAWVNVSN
ncbi:MAG: family 16 glycosylhydrolase [Solirubrobacterales bacterium]